MKPDTESPNKPGTLADTILEALRIAAEMTDRGASRAERNAYIEGVLRKSWPVQREWKYLCEACSDTGWQTKNCTPETPCGRPFRLPKQTNKTGVQDFTGQGQCGAEHSYVASCWCAKGQGFRRQLEGRSEPEDVLSAGATKPRTMTRFGR